MRNHAFPQGGHADRVHHGRAAGARRRPSSARQGIAAVSAADIRWLRCDLKATSLLANCLLRQLAVDAGCAETLLFRDGFLTEGAACNIFVVKDGVLLAPPKNHLMLPGITYDVVLELAAQHGLPHEVRDITEAEVRGRRRTVDDLLDQGSAADRQRSTASPVGARQARARCSAQMYAWYQDFKAHGDARGD